MLATHADQSVYQLRKKTQATKLSLLLICFFLISCGHNQVKESGGHKTTAAWRGKALIFDKVHDKKNTVSMEVISRRPKSMRMDISAVLGIYIGSFVWNDSRMQVLLAREKKFINGPANADSMQELLKMQIDPQVLLDIFWDNPFSKAEWNCEVDAVGLSKSCKHKTLAIRVIWQEREGHHRLIEIDSPKVNAQLSLNDLEEDVEIKPTTFQLKAPESFRMITL